MNIVLMGYHGCGKRAAGKRLANRLWKQFVEVGAADALAADASPVREALAGEDRVIVLGADVLLKESSVQAVKSAANARRIYLRCPAEVLFERLRKAGGTGVEVDEVRRQLALCAPGYEAAADRVLDVTHLDVEGTVRELIRRCL